MRQRPRIQRRLVIGVTLVLVIAVTAVVIAFGTRGSDSTQQPHAARATVPRREPPTSGHTPPTATGHATRRLATSGRPSLQAEGWADSLASDWQFCVPGTVLGYATGNFRLYPQFSYTGVRDDTQWTLRFYRDIGGRLTLVTTVPSFTVATNGRADGCVVIPVRFDEADPLEDGRYVVQPSLDGVSYPSASLRLEMGGSDGPAGAARRQRTTCVDLPAPYWPGGKETNDVAFGRASVGLDSAELDGQIVFFPGRAAFLATIGYGYTDFASADLAARRQVNQNAFGAKYLRYVVVRTGDTYAAFVARTYSAFVGGGLNQNGDPAPAEPNAAPPPCLLSPDQATVVSWHAATAAYGPVGGDLRPIAYDWYASQGGTFTFPNG